MKYSAINKPLDIPVCAFRTDLPLLFFNYFEVEVDSSPIVYLTFTFELNSARPIDYKGLMMVDSVLLLRLSSNPSGTLLVC